MSVEAPKVVEETPVVKPVAAEQTETVAPVTEAPVATTEPVTTEAVADATEEKPVEAETATVLTPATEGVLGFKAPGFLKQFHFSKNFFWFSEEPLSAEALAKVEAQNTHSAWAQESGKGVLFYTKRAEDKAHPAGLILLAEATQLLKEYTHDFQFNVGKKTYKFEAANAAERDSWMLAVEKAIEESKAAELEITSRDSYKKTIEGFAVAPAATKAERSSSKGPSKAVETPVVPIAAAATTTEAVPAETAASVSSSDKEEKKAEKAAKKERSQSRKRASIFGMLGKKDEDKEAKEAEKQAKKDQKAAEKAEKDAEKELKKVEAEHVKEEKKAEAEAKKEEVKATHDTNTAVEAAEAAAIAVAPAAAVAAVEEKKEEKAEKSEASSPVEKKNKRSSVFGGFFSKKVTSPTTEKEENEASVIAPTTESEVPPVSETAPKLDEPIENKPIDTAAVTAPVDTVEPPAATAAVVEEPTKDAAVAPASETVSPKTEKKGGFLGFIKKAEAKKEAKKEEKEEAKVEKAAGEIAEDPVAAAAPAPVEPTTIEAPTHDAVTETPAVVEKDERATREKRRSSFFGSLGAGKKANAPESAEAEPEVKRGKSPLPSRIGSIFRKSSKTVKPAEADATTESEAVKTDATEVPANATIPEPTESKIVGDVVPTDLTNVPAHAATTIAPAEVKASA